MSNATIISIVGYAISQALICGILDASAFERLFGILGGIPIGYYGAICDTKGT